MTDDGATTEHLGDAALAREQFDRRQRLHGLAQAHVIAEDRAYPAGEEDRAAELIVVERYGQKVECERARIELGEEFVFESGQGCALDLTIDEIECIGADRYLFGHGFHCRDQLLVFA